MKVPITVRKPEFWACRKPKKHGSKVSLDKEVGLCLLKKMYLYSATIGRWEVL
jgi:hypothetical protein